MKYALFSLLLLSFSPLGVFAQASSNPSALDELTSPAVRYVCPMHSHIVKDHAGTCPICGMDLVPREQKMSMSVDVGVTGEMQQAMALTTEIAQESRMWRFINTYGSVQFDETGLNHIHPRTSGWLETLTVNSLGQNVKKGELLYEIYSPELLVAQEDFLLLLSSDAKNSLLLERSKRRLSLLGLSDKLIAELMQKRKVFYRVPYYAQHDGIVSALDVREGMYVEPNVSIMTLADLSRVWVIADVFEHQIDWVKVGKAVEIDLPALDIYQLEGNVEFIYPTLDPVSRTLQVRLALENPQQRLKPDMLATVRIYAGPLLALNIPVEALIQTEKHNRVFVQMENGRFERRDVEVGIVTQGRAEIRHGLNEGERIVTSGQFLLDAEANLNNVATAGDAMPMGHQH
ncbi:efflux RND transporter periplasmic adaptor subunit [Alteromonas facilis]|uniref:efflux RND transporter periplasmic adaptor subunit n=1 Tax=Alteromonas facilis TaxID=2048004 RepID=UPI0013DC3780|nr:efflux RND transporter periplasmic adaptor subunit [Alteromonas facilis]